MKKSKKFSKRKRPLTKKTKRRKKHVGGRSRAVWVVDQDAIDQARNVRNARYSHPTRPSSEIDILRPATPLGVGLSEVAANYSHRDAVDEHGGGRSAPVWIPTREHLQMMNMQYHDLERYHALQRESQRRRQRWEDWLRSERGEAPVGDEPAG